MRGPVPPEALETIEEPAVQHSVEGNRGIQSQGDIKTEYFDGNIALSPRAHKNLSRSILILDAVIRGWDKSDATLRAWRNLRSQPLRRQIREHPEESPALVSRLLGEKSGVRLTINDAARELSIIWNGFQPEHYSESSVLAAIKKFLPSDVALEPNAPARIAFEKARHIVKEI
jgi:hypothetical protein